MKSISFLLLLLFGSLLSTPQARSATGSCHGGPLLSVGGGIASSSPLLGLDDNPAALPCAEGPTLTGAAYSGDPDFNGRLLYGGKGVGVGIGYDNQGNLRLGAAAELVSTFAFGFSIVHDVPNDSGWGVDLGATARLGSSLQLGAKVYSVTQSVKSYGVGLAWDFRGKSRFAVDYAFVDRNVGKGVLKPGLAIVADPIELSLAYGIGLASDSVAPISSDVTVGAGFHLGRNLFFSGYYNHLVKYYGSIAIRL